MWSSGRVRSDADDLVEPAQIRDTSDLEIPVSTPSASTRSSTAPGRDPVT